MNLAAGRFCIALEANDACNYASNHLDAPGRLAAIVAITPKGEEALGIQDYCDSGLLEPIEFGGHASEYSVSEHLYTDLKVQWHSLLRLNEQCEIEYFRVSRAQTKGPDTLEITLLEQPGGREATMLLNKTTGEAGHWEWHGGSAHSSDADNPATALR